MVCPGGPSSSSANISVFPLHLPGDVGWEESVLERSQVLLSDHQGCHLLVHEVKVFLGLQRRLTKAEPEGKGGKERAWGALRRERGEHLGPS